MCNLHPTLLRGVDRLFYEGLIDALSQEEPPGGRYGSLRVRLLCVEVLESRPYGRDDDCSTNVVIYDYQMCESG